MYTQCSKCETVFKLSAEALRAAGGQVRCGRCGEVFNALQRLAEDSSGFAAAGESPLDLEARADSILESVVVQQADAAVPQDTDEEAPDEHDPDEGEEGPPGVEIAHLEILDLSDDDAPDTAESAAADQAMEFSLPPGELDRIFIESKRRSQRNTPLDVATAGESAPEDPASEESAAEPDRPPPHPESALARGFEVSEAVRREMLAGIDQAARREGGAPEVEAPEIERRSAARRNAERRDAARRRNGRRSADRRPFMLWLSGAIVAALLLLVQLVHFNREWLMDHGPFGGALRALYSAFGSGAAPPNLSVYQLRQWGVTGDPGANGTLRVRASILNAAAEPEPYPLLRVMLANRFGKRIGARDFEPAEYLGAPPAGLLGAGVRVDATLEILDPGKDAEGFEIDVCLRQSDHRIFCAGDAAAQMKK